MQDLDVDGITLVQKQGERVWTGYGRAAESGENDTEPWGCVRNEDLNQLTHYQLPNKDSTLLNNEKSKSG